MKLNRETILSGRYNIRALLGEGGMGVVYRAFDEQLRRMVAIKTIQGDKAEDKGFLKRFKREALAISQIDHPHIVRLLDFVEGTAAQPPYMVMELLEGRDMGTVIRDEGALDISRAVTRTLEASVAIGECHRHGYLHRDVKPNNIFLHQYNQVETAKVLDFGAAKQDEHFDGHHDDTAELTKKGFVLGTPYYMPPEQVAGRPATAKSDQYSLAVVLYMAVTGRKPFQVKKPKQEDFKELDLLQLIRQGDYTPVQKVRPEVPAALAEAIHRAMSLEPEKRFPDLHSFGAALRAFASPQAKLTWEAHFTSDAPVRRNPELSLAISAKNDTERPAGSLGARASHDPTFTAVDSTSGTGPTTRAKGTNETIALTTAELKESGDELNLATTTKQPTEAPSRSLSIVIEEASQPFESLSSPSSSAEAVAHTTSPNFVRDKPAMIVVGALAMLVAVLAVSFGLTHHKDAAPTRLTPPADLTNRPSVAAAQSRPPSIVPQAAAVAATPPPSAAAAATAATPAVAETHPAAVPAEVRSETAPGAGVTPPRHRAHKKRAPHFAVDPHGIPIPAE